MPDKKNTTEAVTEERNDPSVARTMENIRELTEKNLAISEEILEKTKHINRFVTLSQIMGVIKLLLIVVPIILGVLYLPSLLKGITPIFGQVLDVYKELLGVKRRQAESDPHARKWVGLFNCLGSYLRVRCF